MQILLDGNYRRMLLRAILNKSRWQHPTKHQLYGHLSPIMKTIQVRRTRHAGHCWRSWDEPLSDVLLWTPTYGWAKAGRPAWTYIQQLCEDTGCSPEDMPEAMNNREEWWERVRDIRAGGTTWWWDIYIYIYIYTHIQARQMNPATGQQHASPDAGQMNHTGQRPGSYSSVRNLLLLIIKGGIYWWGKKYIQPSKRLSRLSLKPYVQTALLFVWVKKGCILLRSELWPQCLKNQLKNSSTNKDFLNVKAQYL